MIRIEITFDIFQSVFDREFSRRFLESVDDFIKVCCSNSKYDNYIFNV